MQVTFKVQGSSADPYLVTFTKNDQLFASCTCKSGQMGQHCRHRLDILSGNSGGIVSENLDDVAQVGQWLIGTRLAEAMAAHTSAETELERAKKRAADAKKALARVMQEL